MLKLVIDTNLFHEFRPLEDLPWADLGELGCIELIVTDVVQTELDEHKKSTRARLKRTAIKITKQFREMLLAQQSELEIRASEPRVTLSLSDMNFGSETYGTLDLNNLDDQLVAIAKRLADRFDDGSVHLFSNDTRPMRKAIGVGLKFLAIPEEWRRAEEQTDEEQEKSRLADENKRLRSQEPILEISSAPPKAMELTLPIYAPLSDDEIDKVMDRLLKRNPKETNFARDKSNDPKTALFGGLTLGITQYEFKEAALEDVEAYLEVDYPQWETSCREKLQEAHIHLAAPAHKFPLDFLLSNTGTRPANDVLLTISAKGALLVMPPAYRGEDEGENTSLPVALDFPSAPKAPQGKWKQLRTSMFGILASHDPVSFAHAGHLGLNRIPYAPPPANPNLFYYVDRPNTYLNAFALTCAQFRHAGEPEDFECMCFVDGRAEDLDGKSAIVEIMVEASNLTDPVKQKLIVRFRAKQESTFEAVCNVVSGVPL